MDRNYINATVTFQNSSDGENSILNYDVIFLIEVIREQQRLKVFIPQDKNDRIYTKLYLSTPIDTCKIHKGNRVTLFTKVMFENFMTNLNVPYTCPFPKNSHHQMRNCTLTDNFLPPIPVEQKFKVELDIYGIVGKKKKWTYLYGTEFYGRCRKWIK